MFTTMTILAITTTCAMALAPEQELVGSEAQYQPSEWNAVASKGAADSLGLDGIKFIKMKPQATRAQRKAQADKVADLTIPMSRIFNNPPKQLSSGEKKALAKKNEHAAKKAEQDQKQNLLLSRILGRIPNRKDAVVPEMSLLTVDDREDEPESDMARSIRKASGSLMPAMDHSAIQRAYRSMKTAQSKHQAEKAGNAKAASQMSALMSSSSNMDDFAEDSFDGDYKPAMEDSPEADSTRKDDVPEDDVPEKENEAHWAKVATQLAEEHDDDAEKQRKSAADLMHSSLELPSEAKDDDDEGDLDDLTDPAFFPAPEKVDPAESELVSAQMKVKAQAQMKMKMTEMSMTHSKRHVQDMLKAMKQGSTFDEAHKIALLAQASRQSKAGIAAHKSAEAAKAADQMELAALLGTSHRALPGHAEKPKKAAKTEAPTKDAETKVQVFAPTVFSSQSMAEVSDDQQKGLDQASKFAADLLDPPPLPTPAPPSPPDAFTTLMSETLDSLSKHGRVTERLPSVVAAAKAEKAVAQEAAADP
jgi:hypothetical protein